MGIVNDILLWYSRPWKSLNLTGRHLQGLTMMTTSNTLRILYHLRPKIAALPARVAHGDSHVEKSCISCWLLPGILFNGFLVSNETRCR